ncbi:MAG: CYCXC family (seleno)protein [Nitrospinota bacterium]|nr:CYCXC family (seleno)protein [Nitrospinota bacterium]
MEKKNRKNKSGPPKKKRVAPFALVTIVVLVLATVYFMTKTTDTGPPVAPAKGLLIENRPVLSPALFIGDAAKAYQYAAEIPKVIDSLFCYCYCKKNHGHKTLLTCFTSNHGSKCDTCIGEVLYAHELYQKGKTLDEIVVEVDRKFYRPYKPHRSL